MILARLFMVTFGCSVFVVSALLNVARLQTPQPAAEVYVNDADGFLYRQWRDGSRKQVLIPERGIEFYRSMVWSPDSRWIAFVSYDVYLVNSFSRQIKHVTMGLFSGAVSWSPDSTSMAFQGYDGTNWDIYVVRAKAGVEGSMNTIRRLTKDSADDITPMWSQDEEWIVFASLREGNWDIFRMHPDGTALQNLTASPQNEYIAGWSQDGEWVLFSQDGIYGRMRPDGGELEMLGETLPPLRNPQLSPVIDLPWHGVVMIGLGVLVILFVVFNDQRAILYLAS